MMDYRSLQGRRILKLARRYHGFNPTEKKMKEISSKNQAIREYCDKRYEAIAKLTIREIEKRNLEFNDENILDILNVLLETKYFERLKRAMDNFGGIQGMINAVKRRYNKSKQEQQTNNEKNQGRNDER